MTFILTFPAAWGQSSNLGAGIYYLSMRTQNGVATEKLIVR